MKTILLLIATAAVAIAQTERGLVDLTTGEVLGYKNTAAASAVNPQQWVPVTRNAKPAYDPATQRLERVVTVAPDRSAVTVSWNIVAIPQAEIDARTAEVADAAVRAGKMTNVVNAIATLRQWALDAQTTNVNNGNNNAVTQQMVDRLGIFFDRFADLLEGQAYDN